MKRAFALLAVFAGATAAYPAARLTYMIHSRPAAIGWALDSFPLRYVIDEEVERRLPGSRTAITKALGDWEGIPESIAAFELAGTEAVKAGKDGKNSISFRDKLFEGSGFIAFTTTFYDDAARISEADIQIDPAVAGANVNFQELICHEAGHMLGLDHSAVLTSVMYPFVGNDTATGLDSDDRVAMATMYPKENGKGGEIRGEVRGPMGPIFGAQVVAVSAQGVPVASVLTDAEGRFAFDKVPAGSYRLYAEPLDGPVDLKNLSGVWRDGSKAEYRTEFLSGGKSVEVTSGGVVEHLELRTDGLPASLNARWIGSFPAASPNPRLGSVAAVVSAGQSVSIAVGGDGFVGGLTEFEVMNPGFRRVSEFRYGSNYVWATFQIAPDVPASSMVVLVRSGNETATLTGALKVARPDGASRRRAAR